VNKQQAYNSPLKRGRVCVKGVSPALIFYSIIHTGDCRKIKNRKKISLVFKIVGDLEVIVRLKDV